MSKSEEFEALWNNLDAQANGYDSLDETIDTDAYQRARQRYHDFCTDNYALITRALRMPKLTERDLILLGDGLGYVRARAKDRMDWDTVERIDKLLVAFREASK